MKTHTLEMKIYDNLTQSHSKVLTKIFNDAAEATVVFYEYCGKMLSDGLALIFKAYDEEGYIEEHYSNNRITIELILKLEE